VKVTLDSRQHNDAGRHFVEIFRIKTEDLSVQHLAKILSNFLNLPYENLSKILKLNRHWESEHLRFPEEVVTDHERFKLGGTCFSLTFTLKSILDFFSYKTYVVMADMPAGANTHCALVWKNRGEAYLLDPGYLLARPLEIHRSVMNDSVSLIYEPTTDRYVLWTTGNKKLKRRYSFTNVPTGMGDFQNYWEQSFHWMTMHGICLAKRDESGFTYLHNHYLKRSGSDLYYKGNFNEGIAVMARKYFEISPDVVRQAEQALRDNLYFDKELGFQVPRWLK
jgi:arylamine N-acetyltransferase